MNTKADKSNLYSSTVKKHYIFDVVALSALFKKTALTCDRTSGNVISDTIIIELTNTLGPLASKLS